MVLSRQVFWGVTLYCTASGCRRFETTSEVLWNTSLRNVRKPATRRHYPIVTGCDIAESHTVWLQKIHNNLKLHIGSSDVHSDPGRTPPERVVAFLVTGPRRVGVTQRTDGEDAKNTTKLVVTRVRSALQCRTLPITCVQHLQEVPFSFAA